MRFLIAVPLFLLCVLCACSCKSDIANLLDFAEAHMDEHPDSVKVCLERMNPDLISDPRDQAHYALLLTQARNKTYEMETNDSLIDIAVRYFEEHALTNYLMKSYFYKAEILFNGSDYSAAVIWAMRAKELACELGEAYWVAKSAELLSGIFMNTYNCNEDLRYNTEAVLGYRKAGKSKNYKYALCDLAVAYADNDSLQASLLLLDSVRQLASVPVVDSSLMAYCIGSTIPVCLYHGDYQRAKRHIQELAHFRNYYSLGSKDYTYMAEVKIALGEQDSLKEIVRTAQALAATSPEKAAVCYMLATYFESKGLFREAKRYTDSVLMYQNDIVKETLRQSVVMAQRDFYSERSEQEGNRAGRMKRIIIVGSVAFVCLCLLGVYGYRCRMKIKNAEMNERMNEILVLSEKIQNEIHENRILSLMLSEKDRDISCLTGKLALQQDDILRLKDRLNSQHDKSESLKQLIENLFKDRWKTINVLCDEFFEKGDSEKTKATIVNEIEKEIKRVCSPKNLKEIEIAVDNCMDGIVSKLRKQCPFLKPEDIQFVSLLYAGFAPRAVCLFTGIKLKYFYNKRSRLMERILNSEAPDRELFAEKMK